MHTAAAKGLYGDCHTWSRRMNRIAKSTRSQTFWLIALLLFILFSVSTVRLARSADLTDTKSEVTTLSLRPLAIIDYSLGPGTDFDVNVTAFNVTGLHGFNLMLAYDANLVEWKTVQKGDLLANDTTISHSTTVVNGSGDVYASLTSTSPDSATSGNGTLIQLQFHVLNRGETSLRLHNVNLYRTNGTDISYVAYNGYFNNKFLVDVALPLTLLAVTLASVFLNKKTEAKLKTTLEDKEFKVRDVVLLVGVMVVMISSIVFLRGFVAPLMILFLFSYSMLLFIFTYLFSKQRWYVAVVTPTMFILLYFFLRDGPIWADYLVSIYGVVFALLITLYIESLFSWKPMLIFAGLFTTADVVMVLVTGTMIQAFNTTFVGLNLPVVVAVPVVPPIVTARGFLPMALGGGDFFFPGLLSIQTFKKYGKTIAIVSVISMTISFFLFEMFLLTFWRTGFPGTVMIICGWLPVVAGKVLKDRYQGLKEKA